MHGKGARLILLVALALMLSAFAASASEYFVTISPDYQNIKMGDVAEYEITIKNNLGTTENFEIYSPDVAWDVTTDPASDKLLTIDGQSTKTAKLLIKPLYVNPGRYGIAVHVKLSGSNMMIRNFVMTGVNDPNPPPGEYLPALRTSVGIDKMVDPRENLTVMLDLENQNRRNLEVLDIKLRSEVINYDYKTSLGPLEKKKIAINIPIEDLTKPQDDILRVLIFTKVANKTYQHESIPVEFEIMHYGGIVESFEETKEFLKTTRIITLTNAGNGDIIEVYKTQKGFFERVFTSAEPEAKKIKEDGMKYLGWSVSLAPYESTAIKEVVSYRLPFGILAAIIIIYILYYLMRSPVIVHKSATVLATKEGGISELKVLIIVKNRSPKPVGDVHIIDKAPHIANVSNDFEMGTLHPTKVLKHAKKGTLIKWELKELDKFEERVLSYKIKTRLSVLGNFTLPVVVVKFESGKGKQRSTHSNSVTLVSG